MKNIKILTDLNDRAGSSEGISVFVPAMAQFAPDFAIAALSFPLTNVNNETARYLSASDASAPVNCYCGLFVLDPFTNWDELAPMIHYAGFRGICNFPSLPSFDNEEALALKASGYSYEAEVSKAKELSKYGLDLLITYRSERQLEQAQKILSGVKAVFCEASAKMTTALLDQRPNCQR
jgi:predicted TIM-barrel enzyme